MKISDAYRILNEDGVADHARYFNDVYKIHDFKDSDELKNYFEFILHEPELWLKSFPSKLKSKPAFSKPKTAILKLLRNVDVISEYGKTYCENVHDVIDSIYKKNVDAILESRKDECVIAKEEHDDEVGCQPVPNKISHIIDSNNISRKNSITPQIIIKNEDEFEVESIESEELFENSINHIEKKEIINDNDELRELQKKYRVLKKAYEELAKGTLNPAVVSSIQTILSLL